MKWQIRKNRKGFTIIELMLAMGFLSALLVTIAFLVIQITGIYQKGLSLRAVSAEGKQLIDEFTRVVAGSPIPAEAIMPETNDRAAVQKAIKRYFFSRNGSDSNSRTVQHSGTFCTGSYSYIWNTRYAYGEDGESGHTSAHALRLRKNGAILNNDKPYRLARVMDTARDVCAQANDLDGGSPQTTINVTKDPIELINGDESDLILYDFTVFPAAQQTVTGQTFYSATFILATIRGGVDIVSSGDFCSVDEGTTVGLSSDFNYCAVNKFNFAMRATGFSEGEDQYGDRGDN